MCCSYKEKFDADHVWRIKCSVLKSCYYDAIHYKFNNKHIIRDFRSSERGRRRIKLQSTKRINPIKTTIYLDSLVIILFSKQQRNE